MRAALAIALVVIAVGCGGTNRVAPPPNPPELPSGMEGPPPVWIEISTGSRWLNYSTFCWPSAGCADYELARCTGAYHAPVIRVREGESLRFHLGFDPKKVLVHVYTGALEDRPETEKLETSRTPSWGAKRAEPLVLTALPRRGGHASYVACLIPAP